MRLGWLINNFADPGLRLSPEQRREVFRLTHERHLRGRLLVYTVCVVVPPLLAALWATSVIDGWVAAALGLSATGSSLLLTALVVLLSWPWSAWAYGRLYTRPYRRALRDAGVRVCIGCGYGMEGLVAGTMCPECGEREPAGSGSPHDVPGERNTPPSR